METATTNKPVFIPYTPKVGVALPDNPIEDTVITTTSPEILEKVAKILNPYDLGHHKLLSCLYFIFDAFERSGLDFFLVRDTARKAMTEYMLEGDHLDIGIRKLEWANDQKDLLFPYFDQEHVELVEELPDSLTFKWQDIPFTIHLYDDNPCLTALIPIVYENEHWKIPNQFDRFEKEFDK